MMIIISCSNPREEYISGGESSPPSGTVSELENIGIVVDILVLRVSYLNLSSDLSRQWVQH